MRFAQSDQDSWSSNEFAPQIADETDRTNIVMTNSDIPSTLIRPDHVAIIMDGNGRWAKKHGLPRTSGHKKGVETLRQVVRTSFDEGIKFLTLFAFSSENWSRPAEEVGFLMGLLKTFIKNDLAKLHKDNVRVRIIGRRDNLQADILSLLLDAEATTSNNTGLDLIIAFNYGARDEMVRATKALIADVQAGKVNESDVSENTIAAYLDTSDIPDPDLIIRSSGEQRLSNFLLWQSAYAEFVFVDEYWPDFTEQIYQNALAQFSKRERRFGGVESKKIAVSQ